MYPTDLTQTQWQFIKKALDFDDRKRKYDLIVIWNAISYLVKTGCQWRLLPYDFSKMAIGLLLLFKMVKSGDFRFIIVKIKGKSTRQQRSESEASL
jgi:putative transposase